MKNAAVPACPFDTPCDQVTTDLTTEVVQTATGSSAAVGIRRAMVSSAFAGVHIRPRCPSPDGHPGFPLRGTVSQTDRTK